MIRSAILYIIRVALLTVIFSLLFWKLSPTSYKKDFLVHAPLPDFLNLTKNSQVGSLDLWAPFIEKIHADEPTNEPYTAKSILMYDLTTNRVLFEKNPGTELPMASLTKVMTATIALSEIKSPDAYTVPEEALVGEDSMGLSAGEKLSHTDLLYGLMLNSGNDAAEVFARNYPGGRSAFVTAMNDKAKALGLTHTHFTNPTGLEGDGDQHTTTSDLLVIVRNVLQNYPEIKPVASTYEYDIPQTGEHKAYTLYNETNLLTTYPGVHGLKTGYTPEAGLCLITLLHYQGHEIVGIVLGSDDRRGEMIRLLDYSLTSLGIKPPKHS